jgi:predicted RNase H-like HicB family nuclease
MPYTVILFRDDEGHFSVSVPAMPGCYSAGQTREEALGNVREAMEGWLELEAEQGRGPLSEVPALILDGVSRSLDLIDEMRAAGEIHSTSGYDLELATVELPQRLAA